MINPINSNPIMGMFGGGGGEAFQRGMMIGNVNSPFSSVAQAMKGTVDRYRQNIASQQEQQNALELEKAKYGMANGQKAQYAAAAQAQLEKLRAMNHIDDSTGITYFQGARYMDDPAGGGRRLISNATANEGYGVADWGPWGYAPAENVMQDVTNSSIRAAMPSTTPPRPLPRVGAAPSIAPSPLGVGMSGKGPIPGTPTLSPKDQALLDLINKI
jgi:hypothetical protein